MKSSVERLRNSRVKSTSNRVVVLQAIEQAESPRLRVEDVVRELMKNGTQISVASVYRTLRDLTQEGILARTWDRKRDEQKYSYWVRETVPTAAEHLLICTCCGRTVQLYAPSLEDEIRRVGEQAGMVPSTAQLTIQVVCAACASSDTAVSAHTNGRARKLTDTAA